MIIKTAVSTEIFLAFGNKQFNVQLLQVDLTFCLDIVH